MNNNCMQLVGLNVKWYRYQLGWSQEAFSKKTGFKMAYLSTIETGRANLTCKNIDVLVHTFNIEYESLFNKETAKKAKRLPKRVDLYIMQNK